MRKFFAAAAALPVALMAASPALAFEPRYLEIYGHTGTVVERGRWERDTINLSGPAGSTMLEVLCTGGGGNTWNSYGNMSQEFNQAIADYWCGNI